MPSSPARRSGTLVALAALSATAAFAQSSVTLFGTFDPSIAHAKTTYGGGASSSQTFLRNNSRGTSQISVKGVEDLGGGLNAIFLYEGDFNVGSASNSSTATGAQPSFHAVGSNGGEIYAGLAGGFGSLKLGAPNTPSLGVQAGRSPFGTKLGSGFDTVFGTGHVRESGSVVYDSPLFAGFSASAGYAFKAGPTASSTPTFQQIAGVAVTAPQAARADLGLTYAAGPLRAGVTYFRADTDSTGSASDNKQANVYAQFDVAGATLYAGYVDETLSNGNKQRGYNVAAKYAVSPAINLLGNYGHLNDRSAADVDRQIWALGAEYLLSKRSTLYVRYVAEKSDNVPSTATATIEKVRTALVGMQHNF